MWLDSTNSQILQANLHVWFVRTTNRTSRWVKQHQEELCSYVIQVNLPEHQRKHDDDNSDNQYVPIRIQNIFFFIIHHL